MLAPQPAPSPAGVRRWLVRPSVLVAVLLGLFLMHGGPAAADGGCHGSMPDTTVMSPATAVTAGTTGDDVGIRSVPGRTATDTAVMPSAPARTAADPAVAPMAARIPGSPGAAAGKAAAHTSDAMRGALCLATTPRSEVPSPPLGALARALPAAVLLPWAGRSYGRACRRGPPAGGRDLLLQVCVTRT